MANIELIIEKLESLGFIEVVLSTTEVFWQKKDVKVKFKNSKIIASQYNPNTMGEYEVEIDNNENIFEHLENISQW